MGSGNYFYDDSIDADNHSGDSHSRSDWIFLLEFRRTSPARRQHSTRWRWATIKLVEAFQGIAMELMARALEEEGGFSVVGALMNAGSAAFLSYK